MTQCAENTECIGPFVTGEIPDPLRYQFQDASGAPMDLTGYLAKFVFGEDDAPTTTVDASLVAGGVDGWVEYIWTGTELADPGHYVGELWVGNGTQRYASVRIMWDVRRARGLVPVI